MRETTVRCDRCGDVLESEASVLEPIAGPLRNRRTEPYDLCLTCTAGFTAWLRPTLGQLEPTERVEPLTVPI